MESESFPEGRVTLMYGVLILSDVWADVCHLLRARPREQNRIKYAQVTPLEYRQVSPSVRIEEDLHHRLDTNVWERVSFRVRGRSR